MLQLIIFIGLQASGKTTFYHTHFALTHVHISKDLMPKRNRATRQAQLIEAALQAGRSVVVDNTNVTIADRATVIQHFLQAYGAEIIGYYFESKLTDCLERNRQRTGKARVPEVGLYMKAKELVRPSYQEGFHQLFYVKMALEGTFDIRVWSGSKSYSDSCTKWTREVKLRDRAGFFM
jgi:predicted kinase